MASSWTSTLESTSLAQLREQLVCVNHYLHKLVILADNKRQREENN